MVSSDVVQAHVVDRLEHLTGQPAAPAADGDLSVPIEGDAFYARLRFGDRARFEDRKSPEYDANYPPGLGGYL